jgi:hypothetical protein
MILTPQQMFESMLKMLEDAVADNYKNSFEKPKEKP